MNAQTFCLYSLAAACLVWGALGLRFSLSVLVANTILAVLLFNVAALSDNENLLYALMLLYPLYWGAAFAVFRFLDQANLPALNVSLRFALGCATALCLVLGANWDALAREGNLFRLTYFVDPKERAAQLDDFLKRSDERRLCDDSYATLMRLAVNAKDEEVIKVFFNAFSACNGAAATVADVVKPVLDSGDAASLDFFLQCGLAPDTEVFGHDYANGTALAYAATATGHPELVRLIAESAPEKARHMKYRDNMLEALTERGDKEMLSVLARLGIR